MRFTLGIDPGLSGAAAVLDQDATLVSLCDLPVIRDNALAWIDGAQFTTFILSLPVGPRRAVVERVSSMPGQGVASSFKFGVGYGSVLAVLQSLQVPLSLVTAAKWKRELALGDDKKASLHKARLMWPAADLRLEKHHGRAEALLIAYWKLKHDAGGNLNA